MRRPRGITLLEVVVVVAIIAVLSALAYDAMGRARPRATFQATAAEIQSLVHAARQQALASGVAVAVLVFPDYRGGGSQGRIVVVQDDTDPLSSLFVAGAALNFDNYDPAVAASPPGGQVIATLDLPQGVNVGPLTGLGVAKPPFPFDGAKTDVDCSFCSTSAPRRGAIRFDSRGRVAFYDRVASTKLADGGGSLSIYGPDLVTGTTFATSTLVISRPAGALRTFTNG